MYEYHDKIERRKAQEEDSEAKSDRMEEERIKANLDWAEQEELRELEAAKAAEEQAALEKEIEEAKKKFGDDFGEDIDTDFGV